MATISETTFGALTDSQIKDLGKVTYQGRQYLMNYDETADELRTRVADFVEMVEGKPLGDDKTATVNNMSIKFDDNGEGTSIANFVDKKAGTMGALEGLEEFIF